MYELSSKAGPHNGWHRPGPVTIYIAEKLDATDRYGKTVAHLSALGYTNPRNSHDTQLEWSNGAQ